MNKLWIIDDEQEILDILKFMLEIEGCENYELIMNWNECAPNKGDVVLHTSLNCLKAYCSLTQSLGLSFFQLSS